MNFEKAIHYIQSNSSAIELARLGFVIHQKPASAEVMQQFQASQRPDGGFAPFWAPEYSSLDATCFRLAQAQQLGMPGEAAVIAAALRFLASRQKEDGGWEEDGSVAEKTPPWLQLGDLASKLYLTANCAGWLPASAVHLAGSQRAAAFLAAHQEPLGRLPSFLHTQWLAAGAWMRLGIEEPARHSLDYLDKRFDDLSAGHLAWMVTTLVPAGLPAGHALITRSLAKLERLQQPDGRWQSEDGPDFDVNVTLEALFAVSLVKQTG